MPPNLTNRRRIVMLLLGCLLAVALLAVRIGWLTALNSDQLAKRGLSVRLRAVPVQAARGDIVGAQGHVLARSVTAFSVFAVPAQVRSPADEAAKLASLLDMPANTLQARLSRRIAFVWLKRRVSDKTAAEVKDLALPGVDLAPETRRVYPYGALAAHVLGFSGIDNQGLDGVELTYDKVLRGKPGSIAIEMDARNQRIPKAREVYRPATPGDNVKLTLDMDVQRLVERAADEVLRDTGAKGVQVAIEDVRTGGLVALVNRPSYDPGAFAKSPAENRRDPFVSNDIPPGSTFNAITAATALDLGLVTPQSPFYDPGFIRVNGVPLHCWRRSGHGAVNFRQVVEGSCNVGFVEVGLRIGVKRFYDYLKKFHLLKPTGIDLPGEAGSIVPAMATVKPVDLATMSFGQTLAITPLSLLAAVSAIANDGVWLTPHVMADVTSPSGKLVRTYQPQRERVISESAARTLQSLMAGVVARGSGKKGAVAGYEMAGKTGTAQAVINGRYVEGKYISSFIGYGPLPHPQYAMLVEIEQPQGAYYGGLIAAPVFGRVMAQLFQHEGLKPTLALPAQVAVPGVVGKDPGAAVAALQKSKLAARVLGGGDKVASQLPPEGVPVAPGTQVLLFTAGGTTLTPNLVGMTVDEAARALDKAGLRLVVQGEGRIVSQEPKQGSRQPIGSAVVVQAQAPHGNTEQRQE